MYPLVILSSSFHTGGLSHWAALVVVGIAGAVFILSGKARQALSPDRLTRVTILLALLCLSGIFFSLLASLTENPDIPWAEHLPLHFCDVMAVMCAYALVFDSPNARAIAFFGVVTASAQALITPNLTADLPSLTYLAFFLSHGVIVISAIYIFCVLRWTPRKHDYLVALAFGITYLIAIHPINAALRTNFGFTRFIPESGSILSLLGPWPWYLFTMQIPALLFMASLNFLLRKMRRLKA